MIVKDSIEKVWLIDRNELKKANKIVSSVDYKGKEFAVLKTERDDSSQELLIKDANNEYWAMNFANIEFEHFINVVLDPTIIESRVYCDKVIEKLNEIDLKKVFAKRIEKEQYFNKCELKYISKYYPELYEGAVNSRKKVQERYRQRNEEYARQAEIEKKEKLEKVTGTFEEKLEEIKNKIQLGERVKSEKLQFYKDNEYVNGITEQNCFLYLAKQYGINIPLATQGFINNKLVDYDFGNGNCRFQVVNGNRKGSDKIHEYFEQIYQKVVEEIRGYKGQTQTNELVMRR